MARVFDKPHYSNEALYRLKMLRDIDPHAHSSILSAMDIDQPLNSEIAQLLNEDMEEAEVLEDFAYEFGANKDPYKLQRTVLVAHEALNLILPRELDNRVKNDSEGAITLLGKYIRGEVPVVRRRQRDWQRGEDIGKESAVVGLVSSFVTPHLVPQAVNSVKWYRYLSSQYPVFCDMLDVSESWRMAVNSNSSRDHLREVINGDALLDIEELRLKSGTFHEYHPEVKTYLILGLSIHFIDNDIFVFDNTVRAEIHDVLYSTPMYLLYGANHRNPTAEYHAVSAIRYLGTSIKKRVDKGVYLGTLGTQMKKSYNVALANYKSAGPGSIDDQQVKTLSAEADKTADGETPWYKFLLDWDEDLTIDMGTLWNLLPGVDADPRKLADALYKKMETPKTYSTSAWERFMSYAAGVITAHILTHFRGEVSDYEWSVEAEIAEKEPWVRNCLAGTLHYPPDGNHIRIYRKLAWNHTLDFWHFNAHDVTHVYADKKRYETRLSTLHSTRVDNNELLYCMENGNIFSGKWTPDEVRESWLEGKPLGDRICVLAGKRENTKGKDKTRDTESADDVQREAISEGESNLRRLAKLLDGCTTGVGRAQLEKMVHHVIGGMGPDDILDSMDFDGWSPNAVREWHMLFQDLLYSFFKVNYKPSSVFKNPLFVMSKAGSHITWESTDGSVQGFFGTGDTILNSLMCQWAFHEVKNEGGFTTEAKVKKMSLIDDILIYLSHFGGDPVKAAVALNKKCALLGYNAELIKTLLSHVKGHFLNRMYSEGQEVITAAKIFAKANREYTRVFTTIWDRVDSTFGSFLGASDRGADPIVCYTSAMCRAVTCVSSVNDKLRMDSAYDSILNTFIPRSFGGWGMPAFAQWVTRESSKTLHSGLTVITTMADVLQESDPALSMALNSVVYYLQEAMPDIRSVLAVIEDPYNVSLEGVEDPALPIRKLFRKAAMRAVKFKDFRKLMKFEESNDYLDGIHTILMTCEYPAAVIAEWAATLPHAVVRNIFSTIESNEAVLFYTTRREQKRVRGELKAANARAVVGLKKILNNLAIIDVPLISATAAIVELQRKARVMDGYLIRDCVVPGVLDSIRQVESEGSITLHIPGLKPEELFNFVPGGGVKRSMQSKSVVVNETIEDSFADPVMKSYNKMCSVAAVVKAYGSDPTPLLNFWTSAWIGQSHHVPMPSVIAQGSNPLRLCSRISNKNFSVFGWPNAVRVITVNASEAIQAFENMNILVPFLAIIYTLKAAALADIAVGGNHGKAIIRHYDFHLPDALFGYSSYPSKFENLQFDFGVSVLEGPMVQKFLDRAKESIFGYGENVGEFDDFVIQAEVVKAKKIGEIARSRHVGNTSRLITRLVGAASHYAERLRTSVAYADVAPKIRSRSKQQIALDLAENKFEVEVVEVALGICVDQEAKGLRTKVEELVTHNAPYLIKHGLYDGFVAFQNGEGYSSMLRAMNALPTDDRKYFPKMAAKYEAQERNSKLSKDRRYRGHFLAHVMKIIAARGSRRTDLVSRVNDILAGLGKGFLSLWRRFDSEERTGRTKTALDAYMSEQVFIDLETRRKFADSVVEIFNDISPADLKDMSDVIAGLRWACNDLEYFVMEDIIRPSLLVPVGAVKKPSTESAPVMVPKLEKFSFKLDSFEEEEEVEGMRVDNPEYIEFLRRRGIFMVGVFDDLTEEWKAYLKKGGASVNNDI